jgi:hypothetical protein
MSRVWYADDEDFPGQWALWEANLARSLNGAKGQAALRDLETALLELPNKRLVVDVAAENGDVCSLGAVIALRRTRQGEPREVVVAQLEALADDDVEIRATGVQAGVPDLVAWKIMEINDLELATCSPEMRYDLVLNWVRRQLNPSTA